ncbi:hypothetical protein GQX73_g7393 [Xylaria multiplex]|uniref:C2H2-type domain-containing protein n=1 Tax=Xylaria multiplex TaxID=323545 RepID=A0A7C8IXQ3_9PEZI|nr:hypothetical protein GQX73_g7393 [Xylaria multiplex]
MASPHQYSPTTPVAMSLPTFSRTLSNSGSNSADRRDHHLHDDPSWSNVSLDATGDLAGEAQELAEIVLGNYLSTASSLGCGTEGGSSWFENRVEIEQKPDPDDEDAVIIGSPSLTENHVPCPYYVRQKSGYHSCLTRFDLRDIVDLESHLEIEHRQPEYCPTCGATFSSNEDWQIHIRSRSCVSSGKQPPDGITVLQTQRLAELEDTRVSRELRWQLIWEIIFPGVKSPSLPLPSSGIETAVWRLRDFWSAEEDRFVSDFLKKRQPRDCEPNPTELGSLALNIAIDRLVERCKQDENDG